MSVNILTAGRTDIETYFQQSGIREHKKLSHTPLLVFVASDNTIKIEIVERADKLLNYPDNTKVMGQWRGQWSSDFFQFTVGQFREYINNNPRKSHHIV